MLNLKSKKRAENSVIIFCFAHFKKEREMQIELKSFSLSQLTNSQRFACSMTQLISNLAFLLAYNALDPRYGLCRSTRMFVACWDFWKHKIYHVQNRFALPVHVQDTKNTGENNFFCKSMQLRLSFFSCE